MGIARSVAFACAAIVCAACQYSIDMLDRTVACCKSCTVADSTNQVLLLNIVRASQRLPTYYTRLEGDAASLGLTPSGSLSLPLNNPRSFENDINGGPTGAVTSTTSKAVSALGNILGAVGLQASESVPACLCRPWMIRCHQERHDDAGAGEEYPGLPG